jgi:hypothetical protein
VLPQGVECGDDVGDLPERRSWPSAPAACVASDSVIMSAFSSDQVTGSSVGSQGPVLALATPSTSELETTRRTKRNRAGGPADASIRMSIPCTRVAVIDVCCMAVVTI